MIPAFATKLKLKLRLTIINTQKIVGLLLEVYSMTLTRFLLQNSFEKVQFFKGTFLLADTSMEVVLEMLFSFLIIRMSSLRS